MSYIRIGQEGEYVNIPGDGSNYYLYGNGNDIDGWDYEEFAGVLDRAAAAVAQSQEEHEMFREALREEFGGIDHDYRGGVAPPECGEIFLQVLDRRTDVVDVDDELIVRVEEWIESEGPYLKECDHCGDFFRPYIDLTGEGPYFCNEDECNIAHKAFIHDITMEESRELENAEDMDEWEELYTEYVED